MSSNSKDKSWELEDKGLNPDHVCSHVAYKNSTILPTITLLWRLNEFLFVNFRLYQSKLSIFVLRI